MSNKRTKNKLIKVAFFLGFVFLNIFMISKTNSSLNDDNVTIYRLKNESKFRKVNTKTNLKYKIIHGTTISTDINENFEKKLQKFGYEKTKYSVEKQSEIIGKLNSFEKGIAPFDTACLPTYRDIIVYKKDDKITKVIKICTSCFQNEVITKDERTELFLFMADYELLEKMFE